MRDTERGGRGEEFWSFWYVGVKAFLHVPTSIKQNLSIGYSYDAPARLCGSHTRAAWWHECMT